MTQSPADKIPQIEAMRMGVDYRLTLTVRNFSAVVRPLSITEHVEVVQAVGAELMKVPESLRTSMLEKTLLAKAMLVKASTSSPGVYDPAITEPMLAMMTPDELTFLFKQYTSVCDKVNPALENIPTEELTTIVEALKKSPSEAIECSFLQLVNVVRFLMTNGG